jgi:hypothetical protein
LADLHDVAELLTETFIESSARKTIASRRAVAASTEYVYKRADDGGRPTLTIQHRASGLRARFTITSPGLGVVYSKPYDIDSIDPEKPGKLVWWDSYVGLGIGKGIYSEAHRLAPEVRWQTSTLSDHSRALRKKLHAEDPYVWAGHCGWCDVNLPVSWKEAPQSSFSGHP